MSPDVVVVGSAVRDEYYTLSNLPEPDGGAFVRGHETGVGGVGANVAVALSRLGRDVGLVARVGEPDAPTIESHLVEEGVDIQRLRRGGEEPTYSLVLRDGEGERMVVTGGESTRSLRIDDSDLAYCRQAAVVFTYGYVPDPVVAALLDADTPPLVFDLPGPLEELVGRGTEPPTIDRAVAEADLLIAGAVATRDYLGCTPSEGVDRLRDRGVERAALTDGEDGAYLLDGDRSVAIPAFRDHRLHRRRGCVHGGLARRLAAGWTRPGRRRTVRRRRGRPELPRVHRPAGAADPRGGRGFPRGPGLSVSDRRRRPAFGPLPDRPDPRGAVPPSVRCPR